MNKKEKTKRNIIKLLNNIDGNDAIDILLDVLDGFRILYDAPKKQRYPFGKNKDSAYLRSS